MIKCIGCKRTPEEILEVKISAMDEVTLDIISPTQWVMNYNGTYNYFGKDTFYCKQCYINAGEPKVLK